MSLAIVSMTGFARAEAAEDGRRWSWELKSVNGRSLDIRCRLPQGMEALDGPLRALIMQHCKRGSISIQLDAKREGGDQPRFRINRAALEGFLALAKDIGMAVEAAAPRLDGLLGLPGVIERVEEEDSEEHRQRREKALLASFAVALGELGKMRAAEGQRLNEIANGHITTIDQLAERAGAAAALQPAAQAERLKTQLAEILGQQPAPAPERLAQEIALLAAKSDVREELDRLVAHIGAVRALLAEGGAVGRKLDFLCQELNRESNTICSKSADLELTRIGLDLKHAIEQLREQIQNIE